jgi:hypothetical protein
MHRTPKPPRCPGTEADIDFVDVWTMLLDIIPLVSNKVKTAKKVFFPIVLNDIAEAR